MKLPEYRLEIQLPKFFILILDIHGNTPGNLENQRQSMEICLNFSMEYAVQKHITLRDVARLSGKHFVRFPKVEQHPKCMDDAKRCDPVKKVGMTLSCTKKHLVIVL
jgi:hypothetical protein